MLSKNQKKYINSLKQKKHRMNCPVFIVEGTKMVGELLQSDFEIEAIYATSSWITQHEIAGVEVNDITEKELASISSLTTSNEVLAVVKQRNDVEIDTSGLTIALDNIQDPGNLGTIIRIADWFGITNIICSTDCVDVYNPKVVQATMGSIFRVNITYTNLSDFFKKNNHLKVYGALLDGNNVYQEQLTKQEAVLLMGNESKGISDELLPYITNKITIPSFGKAESLNVSAATAVLCSEFKR